MHDDQTLIDFESGGQRPIADGRHRQAFEDFHRSHPEVYEELRRRALQVSRSGNRVGLRCLLESLRWSWAIGDSRRWWSPGDGDGETFKINGNYQRFYRDLLNREPGLEDFFEVRRQRR